MPCSAPSLGGEEGMGIHGYGCVVEYDLGRNLEIGIQGDQKSCRSSLIGRNFVVS